jgi:hypothetical protein
MERNRDHIILSRRRLQLPTRLHFGAPTKPKQFERAVERERNKEEKRENNTIANDEVVIETCGYKRAKPCLQTKRAFPIYYTVLQHKKALQPVEGKERLLEVLDWFREEKSESSNSECTCAFATEDYHTLVEAMAESLDYSRCMARIKSLRFIRHRH